MQHAIGDHALVADGRTAALVAPDGNVAWLCWPRVDSAPCLLSILDDARGGIFVVAPDAPGAAVLERAYVPGTLVLRTVWRCDGAQLTVLEGLAWDGPPRLLRCLAATAPLSVRVTVRLAPDAARGRPEVRVDGAALRTRGGCLDVTVSAEGATWRLAGDGTATALVELEPGRAVTVVLADTDGPAATPSLSATVQHFAARVPTAQGIAVGRLAASVVGETTARDLVRQAAAVLTGLRQRDGGIVAAPTTSLPQWPGGARTWDYRYSWLRDSALAGLAMARCGLVDDAIALGEFIGAATCSTPPAVLLRVDGSKPPAEYTLEHLAGYRGARPVRIGNAAADQPQLDVAGEVLELAGALGDGGGLGPQLRAGATVLADWTAAHWREPDHGIWEIRGAPRHHTHSRVMAWAGLEHAARLADGGVVAGDSALWRGAAMAIRASVLVGGNGALTLFAPDEAHPARGGGGPDAALAQAVLVGFLAPDDPRMHATLDAILGNLDRGGLVDRHLPGIDVAAYPCAPFVFPTFWLASALEHCGRDGAQQMAAALGSRGPLDLFGEVADPLDRTPLGNYPQVQSHAALVLAVTETGPV